MKELQSFEIEYVSGAGVIKNTYDKIVHGWIKSASDSIVGAPMNFLAAIPRWIGRMYDGLENKIVSTITGWITGAIDGTIGKIANTVDKILPF